MIIFILVTFLSLSNSFIIQSNRNQKLSKNILNQKYQINALIDPSVISLAAGSIAGAIGVGVAYPLDTIKTKVQAYAVKSEINLKLFDIVNKILKDEGNKQVHFK
jgi:hypothetical protein